MLASIFFSGGNPLLAGVFVVLALVLSVSITLLVSSMLGKTILKGEASSFTLELPPYRKPQFAKVVVRSILDRTIFVLGRAISVSVPAGALIWLLQNITVADGTLLSMFSNMLEPLGSVMGLSGAILAAFLLGIPANEIVIPILLMYYSQSGMLVESSGIVELGEILKNNGWTIITALCAIVFSLNHFPCATTLWTIAKETKSIKWTTVSFFLPTLVGIVLCVLINIISKLFL
ncbi:MAG: ferrous iron transporter B [Firmicutes bacterium]|jgi:ferrous iron transport protein B|nr:ferrous iron transporter B [Bacillota bacterium]